MSPCLPGERCDMPSGMRGSSEEMVQELTDVAKATILEKRYSVQIRLKRERPVAPAPTMKSKARVTSQEPERSNGEANQCGSHLGQLLRAVKKNGTPLKCLKGANCKFKHGKLGDMTKEAAVGLIATMPLWMQNCLSSLVGSIKGFKS